MKKKLRFGILTVFVVFAIIGYLTIRTHVYPLKYKEQILTHAINNNLDPYLACAIINVESGFKKNATSSRYARGLMQVTQSTAEEINLETNSTEEVNEDTIYDVDVNVEIGCHYLASLICRYKGNYYLAVCAYNAGIGNVNKWLEQGIITADLDTTDIELPFKETTNYLKKVIQNYEIYKKMYSSLV